MIDTINFIVEIGMFCVFIALINRDTFTASGEAITKTFDSGYSFTYTPGTVEVTLRGQTKRVEAKLFGEHDICAYGLVGRYQSATAPSLAFWGAASLTQP